MKNTKTLLILLTVSFSSISFANEKLLSVKYSLPKVTIFYAAIFDTVCTVKTGYKIDPAWAQNLNKQLPQWRALWNQEGSMLLATTTKVIGRPFIQENFQVSLSLCTFPSMSAPLIVNARYALSSFTKNPIPDDVLISNIYHELLHNYIDSFFPKNSPLLTKYKKESPGVLNHLHLFALEKAVYLKLGWRSKLKEVIAKDQSLPNPDYKRAWDIVNNKENYQDFVAELKNYNKSKELYPDKI